MYDVVLNTNVDAYLNALANNLGTDGLPAPTTDVEKLLWNIIESESTPDYHYYLGTMVNGFQGSGRVETNDKLVSAYIYVQQIGTSTDFYTPFMEVDNVPFNLIGTEFVGWNYATGLVTPAYVVVENEKISFKTLWKPLWGNPGDLVEYRFQFFGVMS